MNVEKIEEKELEENKVNDLFASIIQGKDVTEVIKTKRGDFKIKFPRMKDIETIGRLTAYRLNGIPAKCFDEATYMLMNQIATLDILTVSGPAWFELAKKENPNFGWKDIPSQSLIQEAYAKAYNFRTEVQKKIESDTVATDTAVATGEYRNNDSQSGLFEGLSG